MIHVYIINVVTLLSGRLFVVGELKKFSVVVSAYSDDTCCLWCGFCSPTCITTSPTPITPSTTAHRNRGVSKREPPAKEARGDPWEPEPQSDNLDPLDTGASPQYTRTQGHQSVLYPFTGKSFINETQCIGCSTLR